MKVSFEVLEMVFAKEICVKEGGLTGTNCESQLLSEMLGMKQAMLLRYKYSID